MKLTFVGVGLVCLMSVLCEAQESTQSVSRVLPARLNAPPPPLPSPVAQPVANPEANHPTTQRFTQPATPPVQTTPAINSILAWDSELKEYNVKQGENEAHFTFHFTNISSEPIIINSAAASCGCTVPKLPSVPWTNGPGAAGEIPVTMNLLGKSGIVFKTVTVNTDKGSKVLTVKSIIPQPQPPTPLTEMDRNRNQDLAKADRQAVFKGDCAKCHVEPTKGLLGKALYEKACGICHESPNRATMVADLHNLNHDTNADYWKTWISMGKPGSLMPGFSASEGGPLSEGQINSIVQYLVTAIPAHPVRTAATK